MATQADLTTDINCGFYGITVNTKAAREWFSENVQTEGWQWLGNTLGIDDGRTFEAIVDGAQAAGLEVE